MLLGSVAAATPRVRIPGPGPSFSAFQSGFYAPGSGIWGPIFDFTDLSTMFQDTAGTVPVTAAGQRVARVNDLSEWGMNVTQSSESRRPYVRVHDHRYVLSFEVDADPDTGTGISTVSHELTWSGTTVASNSTFQGLGGTPNFHGFLGMSCWCKPTSDNRPMVPITFERFQGGQRRDFINSLIHAQSDTAISWDEGGVAVYQNNGTVSTENTANGGKLLLPKRDAWGVVIVTEQKQSGTTFRKQYYDGTDLVLQRDYTRSGTPHGNYTHLTLGNRSNWLEGGIRSEDAESYHGYMGRLVWCNSANAYPYDVTPLADTRAFLASWLDGYATLVA